AAAYQIEGVQEQRTVQSGGDVPLRQIKHGLLSLPPCSGKTHKIPVIVNMWQTRNWNQAREKSM
ncbi:hypothetical protein KS083_13150, partial [Klebsiella pneumoniae subsp. ozaenae]|nr:hypothetical protein [Klebsiella pneumoniae subsp. ozaenae]